jgi:hypothetical protein
VKGLHISAALLLLHLPALPLLLPWVSQPKSNRFQCGISAAGAPSSITTMILSRKETQPEHLLLSFGYHASLRGNATGVSTAVVCVYVDENRHDPTWTLLVLLVPEPVVAATFRRMPHWIHTRNVRYDAPCGGGEGGGRGSNRWSIHSDNDCTESDYNIF